MITDGNAVDLSPYLDDTDTDDQTISISNDSLIIQDGNSVDLSAYAVDNVNDADADPNNELQALSLTNDTLLLTNGGSVDLSGYNADTLSIIEDQDQDTKIEVERNTDEDLIRFRIGGPEYFRLDAGRIQVISTGQSVFLGNFAGENDDLGFNQNVFVGHQAGRNNITGTQNVAVGLEALRSNNPGYRNVALGPLALTSNTSGHDNVGIGYGALLNNKDGNHNIAIGERALNGVDSSLYNIGIGGNAGYYNRGDRNVLLGYEAGGGSVGIDYSGNVFLGYNAGRNEGGSDLLYIENSNSSSPLIWGDFANDSLKIYGTLGVRDNYVFPDSDGTAGQVLGTDGTGQTAWVDGPTGIADTDKDTRIQVEENPDEDIIRFDMGGTEYFRMDSPRLEVLNSGQSVFVGEKAGANDNLTTNRNVFVGFEAGQTNVSGSNNVAIGYQTFKANTSGLYNTVVGAFGMDGNTNGSYNAAYGYSALRANTSGADNSAFGANALQSNTQGDFNVAMGSFALSDNTTGLHNTGIGYNAGNHNQTGNNNTFLGYEAGKGANNQSQTGNVMLGYQAGMNELNSNLLYIENTNSATPLIWGDFANDILAVNGNLGVGTTSPAANLDVDSIAVIGNIAVGNQSTGQGTSNANGLGFLTTPWVYTNAIEAQGERGSASSLITIGDDGNYGAADEIHLVTNGSSGIMLDSDGDVGIGTTNPAYPLQVVRSASGGGSSSNFVTRIDNPANAAWANVLSIKGGENTQTQNNRLISFHRPNNGEIGSVRQSSSNTVSFNTTSDRRLKTNFKPSQFGLDQLLKIQVVDYSFKNDLGRTHTGFLAQQLHEHYPEAVSSGGDDPNTDPWGVDYGQVTPLLVKSVQEQQETIASLMKMVEELKAEVKILRNN